MSEDKNVESDSGARQPAANFYFAICAAMIGFVFCYALPIYAKLTRPFYDPTARRWFIADHAPPIPMGYYGMLLWGVCGAIVCGAIAYFISSRLRRAPGERAFSLAAAWSLTAIAIVAAYFTWNNWP